MKLLLDENVRADLDSFLKERGVDFIRIGKGASDRIISKQSASEDRAIVTNDSDFASAKATEVYAVILLRIPQNDVVALLNAFEKLLSECKEYEGKLIMLSSDVWSENLLKS